MNFTSSVRRSRATTHTHNIYTYRYIQNAREESTRPAVPRGKKEDPPCYLRLKLPWQAQRNEWRVVARGRAKKYTREMRGKRGEERREEQRRKEQRREDGTGKRDLGRITRPIETRKRDERQEKKHRRLESKRARARKEEREGSSMRYVRKRIYSRSYLSLSLHPPPVSLSSRVSTLLLCFAMFL